MEVVLAAGISALVMAAVVASVQLVYRAEVTGAGRLETVRLGMAVLDRVEAELASLPVRIEPVESTDTSDELATLDGADAGGTSTEAAPMAEGMEYFRPWLSGTAESFVLFTEPMLRAEESAAEEAALLEAGSDVAGGRRREVRWGWDSGEGLSRSTWAAATLTEIEEVPAGGELIIPEVTAFSARYLADGEWYEEWDPAEQGRHPAAVEVTIELVGPASETPVVLSRVMTVPGGRWSLVAAEDEG